MDLPEPSPGAQRMLEALRRKHTPTTAATARMRAGIPALSTASASTPPSSIGPRAISTKAVVAAVAVAGLCGLVFVASPISAPSDPSPAVRVADPAQELGPDPGALVPPAPVDAAAVSGAAAPATVPASDAGTSEPSAPVGRPSRPRPEGDKKPATSEPPPAQASPDTLERELRLLAQARARRRSGEAEAALELVNRHEAEFPRSTFGEDRDLLRIQVLCDLGRGGDAREAIDRFIAVHPGSALTSSVRGACPVAKE